MQIAFLGGSGEGRSVNADPSRSINFFVEGVAQDAKSPIAMVGTAGTKTFVELAGETPVRLLYRVVDRCFAVVADIFYELYEDGTFVPRGSLSNNYGRISAADNGKPGFTVGNQLMMVTGGNGYIFSLLSNTVVAITDENFPENAEQVAYLDGYFIVSNGSMSFRVSADNDGTTWPVFAYATASAAADNIQRPIDLHQQLVLVKETTIEMWQNTGTPTSQGSPFQRIPGAVIDYGTPAPNSVAKGNNTLFFLANARSGEFAGVAVLSGYSPQFISTPAIAYRIRRLGDISDAIGFCYSDEGHVFYQLTFPSADLTLVYDMSMNIWHDRSTHIEGQPYAQHRHIADHYVSAFGKHLVSSYLDTRILEMSSDYYDDDGVPIIRTRVAQPTFDKGNLDNVKINKLIIDCEGGVGDNSMVSTGLPLLADGTYTANGNIVAGNISPQLSASGDPQAFLSWSNDGGHTWSNEYPAAMGKLGQYFRRLIWRRLGSPRNRVFKLRLVAAVKAIITGAYINDGSGAGSGSNR